MTQSLNKSWIESLPFIQRNRLKAAQTTASFKQPYLASLNNVDLMIDESPFVSLDNFQLPFPHYTTNKCFEDYQSFVNTGTSFFHSIPEPNKTINFCAWEVPEIVDLPLFDCEGQAVDSQSINFDKCAIYQLKIGVLPPVIEDHTTLVCGENIIPIIENISFLLGKTIAAGKSYVKKEIRQKNVLSLFDEPNHDNDSFAGKNNYDKPKIKRQFNANDVLDLFDLIFPVLQPQLGLDFSNPIAIPHELYPFQREGVHFLATNTSALLGDEMGLGKSIQTIVAIKLLFRQGKILTGLFICPKAVMGDWEKKLWEWAPELKVVQVEGNRDKRTSLWNAQSHIYLCTYETLRNDFGHTITIPKLQVTDQGHTVKCPNRKCKILLNVLYEHHNNPSIEVNCPTCGQTFSYPFGGDIARTRFDVVVYDEIQKIKNSATDSSKAARLPYGTYRWALSGTPYETKLDDLVSVFTTVKSNIFDGVNMNNEEQVKKAYKPYFKRRRQIDVMKELPPVVPEDVWLNLLPSQRKAYDLAEQQGIVELTEKGDTVTLQHILALITRLKQICNFDPVANESVKLEYLENNLDLLVAQGSKALIFSQYVNTLKRMEPSLKKYQPLIYEGSLSNSQRQEYVDKFQNQAENSIMLISLKAGNAGITLTRANYVFHFDLWWNPAVHAQALGRVQRINQKAKTVFEYKLLTNNTIENRIYDKLCERKREFNRLVDDLSDTDALSSVLSTEELFGLFGLSWKSKKVSNVIQLVEPDSYSNPFEFEEYVARFFNKLGYMTKLTKKSHDGGIDIYARKSTPTGYENVIIQCKHKEDTTKSVGVDFAHALYGVLQADKSYHKGILVTNGKFSPDCKAFVYGKTLELIDGAMLLGLAEKLNTK